MKAIIPSLAAIFLAAVALGGVQGREVIEVGQPVPNMCWTDANAKQVCLDSFPSTVRVLIYSAGWCPACNAEIDEISARVKEFNGQPVTFISLSSQGDEHGQDPTVDFLKSWKERHNIPFVVAAAPKDAGKHFFTPPLYIPNVALVGKDGKLAYKAVAPDVDTLFEEVRKALAPPR